MPDPYRITIYDRQVAALFQPGGEAWHWLGLLGTEHLQTAINMTPVREGKLRNAFYPVPIMTPYAIGGGLGTRYTIRNDSPYAAAVHEGTGGKGRRWGPGGTPLGPGGWVEWDGGRRAGKVAYLGPLEMWGPTGFNIPYVKSVSGQDANPWILLAGLATFGPWMGR